MFGTTAQSFDLPRALREFGDKFTGFGWEDLAWSIGVLATALIVGRILAAVVLRGLAGWSTRTTSRVDDDIVEHLSTPLRWLVPALAVLVCFEMVSLPESVHLVCRRILVISVIVNVGWLLLRGLRVISAAMARNIETAVPDDFRARSLRTQIRVFRNVAAFVIGTLTVAFALMTFDAVRQIGTGLLASAGVAGVVIGFAAQRSIATVVGGIQLALAQPIRVDDVVVVEGEWGRIEEITLTYVVVKIWDLRRLVVPVTYFLERPFQNWTRGSTELLGTVELRLDYSVPVAAVRSELERIVAASPDWDGTSVGVQVTDASDRAITVRALVSAADASKLWSLRCAVREQLVDFVLRNYPHALPRERTEFDAGTRLQVVASSEEPEPTPIHRPG